MTGGSHRLRTASAITFAAVMALMAGTATRTLPAAAATRKVLWVVMENRSYDAVIGNTAAAPYVNGTLMASGGNATNMHSETHPSLPNYIAMTTGSTHGIADDGKPAAHPITDPSIFSQVDPDWRAYQEAMSKNCSWRNTAFSNGTRYVVSHNPAAYMVAAPINAPSADCNLNDLPLGTADVGNLQADLASGSLASFSFVTPGVCHDMHKAPAGSVCDPPDPVSAGDQWLATWMPKILDSPDYAIGALVVFLTWDEGSGPGKGIDCQAPANLDAVGCHIPTLVFSSGTTGGAGDGTYFSHYSMLKTTEELLGLSTTELGPNVSGATSMRAAFNL